MANGEMASHRFLLTLFVCNIIFTPSAHQSPDTRSTVISLLEIGDAKGALIYLESQHTSQVEFEDGYTPSLFYYAGIASQLLGDLEASAAAFTRAVQYDNKDVQSWLNLGDIFLYQYDGEKAFASFEEALYLSGGSEKAPSNILAKVHRAHSWIASWSDIEVLTLELQARLDKWFNQHIESGNLVINGSLHWNASVCVQGCIRLPVMPADFGDFSPKIQRVVTPLQPQADPTLPPGVDLFTHTSYEHDHSSEPSSSSIRPLHVGFLSSDFGVHPVSSLIRGFLKHLQSAKHRDGEPALEVSCWILTDDVSWWRSNISTELELASNGHFNNLHGLSHVEAASRINQAQVDVLVDLNGHTRGSGLPLMRLRPARVQVSWLGYPATTGASFVDYYICDVITCDPSFSKLEFTEKMLYLPSSYIVNDHANMLSHSLVPTLTPLAMTDRPEPEERQLRRESSGFQSIMRNLHNERVSKERETSLLFRNSWYHADGSLKRLGPILASFSNWMKMDPVAFTVWCNVLSRSPHAYLWIQAAEMAQLAMPNLRSELAARGVFPGRMFATPQQPWIHHVTSKTAADLILDTPLKNQHSTSLDALWAGAPLITIAGDRAARRAGASLLGGLGGKAGSVGRVYSLKEYEDIASKLANDDHLLGALRREVAVSRTKCGGLFDSSSTASDFFTLLHTAVEVSGVKGKKSVWLKGRSETGVIDRPCDEASGEIPTFSALELSMLPQTLDSQTHGGKGQTGEKGSVPLLLNIGGRTAREGWTIVNVMQAESADEVDVFAHMDDLHMYRDSSVTAIYASHVLEHASYMRPSNNDTRKGDGSKKSSQLGVFSEGEVGQALSEWHRVLVAGGALLVAVPDLDVLAGLYLNETLTSPEKFFVMRMMFGGQMDAHDYHFTGFDEDLMAQLLTAVGFCEVRRVPSFNLFKDTSAKLFKDVSISLNIAATACKTGDGDGKAMSDEERVYISIPGRSSQTGH